ncbi:DNA/RNA non-specific endonuclease [Dinghuibacter silviterrae]|nr:DNA/RNA non-specific endonuclease [Dinghuibacter silviterrae]
MQKSKSASADASTLSRAAAHRSSSSFSKSARVVQRVRTKESVLVDQVKWQMVVAIWRTSGRSKAKSDISDHIKFLTNANAVGMLNQGALEGAATSSQNQTTFYNEQLSTGFNNITLDNLYRTGLFMSAIDLLENKASWELYRPQVSGGDTQAGTTVGDGAKTTTNTNVKTSVSWAPIDGNAKEGKKMTAHILAPDHLLGSTPSGAANVKSGRLTTFTDNEYIAGHLLNDHLGGPGDELRNITALPKDVNSEQSNKIEQEVKKRVNSDHEIVFYEVEVTYSQDTNVTGNKLRPEDQWYASSLHSEYGTYRSDTDFSKPVSTAHLKDHFTHDLPINSPTAYSSGTGYVVHPTSDVLYSDTTPREPQSKAVTNTTLGEKAKTAVDPVYDITLGDAKQIKLEYVSFALLSMPIKDMRDELARLKEESTSKDSLLNQGVGEINRLELLIEANEQMHQKLRENLIAIIRENDTDKEKSGIVDAELEQQLSRVIELFKQTGAALEEAKKERDVYKEKARQLSYQHGLQSGRFKQQRPYDFPPLSPNSEEQWNRGYEKGESSYQPTVSLSEHQRIQKELEQTRREKDFLQGKLDAIESADRVYQLGWSTGYKTGKYPRSVSGDISFFIPPRASDGYRSGFWSKIELLTGAYDRGFSAGDTAHRRDNGRSDGYKKGLWDAQHGRDYDDVNEGVSQAYIEAYREYYSKGFREGLIPSHEYTPRTSVKRVREEKEKL